MTDMIKDLFMMDYKGKERVNGSYVDCYGRDSPFYNIRLTITQKEFP